jgi:hypothetical protein
MLPLQRAHPRLGTLCNQHQQHSSSPPRRATIEIVIPEHKRRAPGSRSPTGCSLVPPSHHILDLCSLPTLLTNFTRSCQTTTSQQVPSLLAQMCVPGLAMERSRSTRSATAARSTGSSCAISMVCVRRKSLVEAMPNLIGRGRAHSELHDRDHHDRVAAVQQGQARASRRAVQARGDDAAALQHIFLGDPSKATP